MATIVSRIILLLLLLLAVVVVITVVVWVHKVVVVVVQDAAESAAAGKRGERGVASVSVPSAGTRIRQQCQLLVTALMECSPHYVRW